MSRRCLRPACLTAPTTDALSFPTTRSMSILCCTRPERARVVSRFIRFTVTLLALEHALLGADQVPGRFAQERAPAIRDRAAQRGVAPDAAAGRIVRRADHVRQIEKRVTHLEAAVPPRLDP